MTFEELEDYCTKQAIKLYPANYNAQECFRQGFSEAVRLFILNNSRKERCINPNTHARACTVSCNVYVHENCSQSKVSLQK